MKNGILSESSFPVSKEAQRIKSGELLSLFLNGENEPLSLVTRLKSTVEIMSSVLSDDRVKDIVEREIEKYGKEASYKGVKFQMKELGKYDFSECGDPKYKELLEEKERLSEKIKEREAFLKKVPEGETMVDDNTGEVYKLIRPIKKSSYSYIIIFPK